MSLEIGLLLKSTPLNVSYVIGHKTSITLVNEVPVGVASDVILITERSSIKS